MSNTVQNSETQGTTFIPIREIIGKSFKVKDYQRGYKWDRKEIQELLNDVNEHDINFGKYCLQPVIVREKITNSQTEFELIDGQQRITSLYLILTFLNNSIENVFNISYETREESRDFLSTKIIELKKYAKEKTSWEVFLNIDEFKKYDNVDVYHFYTVYNEIYKWFEEKNINDFKENYLNKLLNDVYIIWYDVDKSQSIQQIDISSENVFLNLNAGKIPLTSSELIKALFILECQNKNSKEIAKLKATELALEWDQIENKLHDDSFWFFICDNEKYNLSATRIDYLLDIVNKRNIIKQDDLFSYRVYEKRFKEKNDLNWQEVKNTYNKLTEWYENKELYHYVGFLIVGKIKKLTEVIEKSIGISKSDFKNELIAWIKIEFNRTKKGDPSDNEYYIYHLDNLDYKNSRKECEKTLLLINIEYYIKNLSTNRFPFELFYNETWSVEHINPQNPRDFENVGIIKGWLKSNKTYYEKSFPTNNLILELIENVTNHFDRYAPDEKRKLSDLKLENTKLADLDDLIDEISEDLNLHGISNLTLLDKNSNSKLSNKPFLDKRELILQYDQDGKYTRSDGEVKKVFIPVCTKNVFSKIYTTDKDSVIDSFFGQSDMNAYRRFIETQLVDFLPTEKQVR